MLQQFWTWLGASTGGSPLANLLQILFTASLAISAAYAWFRRRLRHSGAVIARLQDDLAHRTQQLDRSLQREKQLEARCAEVTADLTETALAKLNRELHDGNSSAAHRIVRDWLEREGASISALLRSEAEWATVHAAGDAHMAGLVVAQAYASAAHAIWPEDTDAVELAHELEKCCNNARLEGVPSFREAAATLADVNPNTFLAGQLVDYALELERGARNLESRGFFRLALLQIEKVVMILRAELGATARPTLRAREARVRLLIWGGKSHAALADIEEIAAALTRALGPEHPNTLASRYLLAGVLNTRGRSAEALPIIEDVAAKQSASAELGPEHPNTLVSRYLLARVLNTLGRSAEADRKSVV